MKSQLKFALALMDFHGGQSSGLYAVGSCMLSDAQKGRRYAPGNHQGHSDNEDGQGALSRAIRELQRFRADANFPEAVEDKDERTANHLASRLAKFQR